MSSRPIAEIQADLAEARAALRAALKGQSYSLNTGQGTQTVTRASLRDIRALIAELERELQDAQDPGGGVIAARMRRY